MAPFEPLVGITDHESYPVETTGPERAQEGRPGSTVLAVAHGQAEDLPVPVLGHAGRDDDGLGDHLCPLVRLDEGGVEEDVREADMIEAALAELAHDAIELTADTTDLALLHARIDAERHHEIIDLACRDPVDTGLHAHRPERPVDPSSGLEQRREETALPELRDVELDVTRPGGQESGSAAVAVGRTVLAALVSPRADDLTRLELDELLEHESHRIAQDIGAVTRTDGVE